MGGVEIFSGKGGSAPLEILACMPYCLCLCYKQIGEKVQLATAAAGYQSQSTALSVQLGSQGHAVQHGPHRGRTGALSSHDVSVTQHRDL